MSSITVFLAVLILSLFFGNALLFFFSFQKKQNLKPAVVESPKYGADADAISPVQDNGAFARRVPSPIERKLELAHNRIQDLEKRLSLQNYSYNGSEDFLKRRLDKLDNFRSTAESELIAIKEILAELQKKGITVKSRSFRNGHKGKPMSREQIHRIIYNSSA